MDFDYTSPVIGAVVVSVYLFFLRKAANKKPSVPAEGTIILKSSGGYKGLGYVSIFIGIFCVFAYSINIYKTLDIFLIAIGLAVLFITAGSCLVLDAVRTWIEFDENMIRSHGISGKVKEISWRDIDSVTFNKRTMLLSLKGPTGKVKVGANLVGFPALIEHMKIKLDRELYRDVFQ